MIVRNNKSYETHSAFLNTNWYENEPTNLIVDETTVEGLEMAKKIIENYPYYDVTETNGFVTSVTLLEKPPAPPVPPTQEDRIAALENAMLALLG